MYRKQILKRRSYVASAFFVIAAFPAARPAAAQVEGFNFFKAGYFTQTGPASQALDDYYFTSLLYSTNPTDATAATLTPGTGATVNYSYDGAVSNTSDGYPTLTYGSSAYANQAALDADYPQGTYTVNYSGGTESAGSFSVNYNADTYSTSIPLFDPTTYDGLQDLNANQPFTFSWNTNTPPVSANDPLNFFTIYNDATGAIVYSDAFQGTSFTSVTIPANTLLPDTAYSAAVDFSDRIDSNNANVADTNGNSIFVTQGFDLNNDVFFTTANATTVPEPSAFALLGLGLLPLALIARRRLPAG